MPNPRVRRAGESLHLKNSMASPGSYVCVLLCASIDSQLEVEIAGSGDPQNQALVGLPKALLPIYDSDSMLDHW